jgi:hypothetical protein
MLTQQLQETVTESAQDNNTCTKNMLMHNQIQNNIDGGDDDDDNNNNNCYYLH